MPDYITSLVIARATATNVNLGSGCTLAIRATAGTVLASYNLGSAVFDAASSNGTQTLAGVPYATVSASEGVPADYAIRRSGGTAAIVGVAGTAGVANVELVLTYAGSIASGQTVTVTSLKITGGNLP